MLTSFHSEDFPGQLGSGIALKWLSSQWVIQCNTKCWFVPYQTLWCEGLTGHPVRNRKKSETENLLSRRSSYSVGGRGSALSKWAHWRAEVKTDALNAMAGMSGAQPRSGQAHSKCCRIQKDGEIASKYRHLEALYWLCRSSRLSPPSILLAFKLPWHLALTCPFYLLALASLYPSLSHYA